jgi:hypothetical protein
MCRDKDKRSILPDWFGLPIHVGLLFSYSFFTGWGVALFKFWSDHILMLIGNFELIEPLPNLRNPHVIVSLTPWIDAGSVGSLAIERIERYMNAEDLGQLATPGKYFDFTRYRPIVYYDDDKRQMKVPNTELRYARGSFEHDFIFLHMLEPHSSAEEYIDGTIEVLTHLNIKRFCRIGAMYDSVPHTRPLLVMGTQDGKPLEDVNGVTGNRRSPYQGPTSIMNLVGDRIGANGVETIMLMARLPHYVELEADFAGRTKMLEVLSTLYNFPPEYSQSRRDKDQYERITAEMQQNLDLKGMVEDLESAYDARQIRRQSRNIGSDSRGDLREQPTTPLPPAIEQFLGELDSLRDDSDS